MRTEGRKDGRTDGRTEGGHPVRQEIAGPFSARVVSHVIPSCLASYSLAPFLLTCSLLTHLLPSHLLAPFLLTCSLLTHSLTYSLQTYLPY